MKFAMSDSEIITSYQHAKDQKAQVQILAELNNVTKVVMESKLRELGCLSDTPLIREKNLKQTSRFDEEMARVLFSDGLSDKEIAEKLGVSVTAFATWRRANGMNRPRGGLVKKEASPAPCVAQPPMQIEEEMQVSEPAEEPFQELPLVPIHTDAGELGRLLVELSERYPDICVTVGGVPVTGLRLNVHMDMCSMEQVSSLDLEVERDKK